MLTDIIDSGFKSTDCIDVKTAGWLHKAKCSKTVDRYVGQDRSYFNTLDLTTGNK